MFCTKCGRKMNEGENFCIKCGAKTEYILSTNQIILKENAPASSKMRIFAIIPIIFNAIISLVLCILNIPYNYGGISGVEYNFSAFIFANISILFLILVLTYYILNKKKIGIIACIISIIIILSIFLIINFIIHDNLGVAIPSFDDIRYYEVPNANGGGFGGIYVSLSEYENLQNIILTKYKVYFNFIRIMAVIFLIPLLISSSLYIFFNYKEKIKIINTKLVLNIIMIMFTISALLLLSFVINNIDITGGQQYVIGNFRGIYKYSKIILTIPLVPLYVSFFITIKCSFKEKKYFQLILNLISIIIIIGVFLLITIIF